MASQLFLCRDCGTVRAFNTSTLAASIEREEFKCPVCDQTGEYVPLAFTSGYDRPHMLNIWARASSLERAAGIELPSVALTGALREVDVSDAEDLRDLAVLIELRLHELDVKALREGEDP